MKAKAPTVLVALSAISPATSTPSSIRSSLANRSYGSSLTALAKSTSQSNRDRAVIPDVFHCFLLPQRQVSQDRDGLHDFQSSETPLKLPYLIRLDGLNFARAVKDTKQGFIETLADSVYTPQPR